MKLNRRNVFTGIAAVSTLAAGATAARSAWARYHDGPLSDHFDGVRFFDVNGMAPKPPVEVLRWWASNGRSKWPAWVPSPFRDRPPRRVEGAAWRMSYVGHASFLLQTAGINILIDPVWSERVSPFDFVGPKRVNDPGIGFDDLPPIDVVLVSHNHYDHLDVATLTALATPHRPRIITPLGNDTILTATDGSLAVEAHDWYDRVELSRTVAVTPVPTRHWSGRGVLDRNKALWAGFVIETPAGRIFHVADSGYGTGFHFRNVRERFGPVRLAVLPIGAYEPRWFMRDQHMNPEDAVKAFADCGAELALGHHFGTFQLTDEAIDAPETALVAARGAAGVAAERFRALKPGEVWEL